MFGKTFEMPDNRGKKRIWQVEEEKAKADYAKVGTKDEGDYSGGMMPREKLLKFLSWETGETVSYKGYDAIFVRFKNDSQAVIRPNDRSKKEEIVNIADLELALSETERKAA